MVFIRSRIRLMSMPGRPLVILFVEDNNAHAKLVLRHLGNSQIATQVHRVKDGEAAVKYLNRQGPFVSPRLGPVPDLVLLDLRLPKIDGLEVLRLIKTADPAHRVPVIVLTTSNADGDVARANELKADGYLVKPVSSESLMKSIADLGLSELACQRTTDS